MDTSIVSWSVVGGSVPGAEHLGRNDLVKGRNNQDAYTWSAFGANSLVAIVCDGCGGSPRKDEQNLWGYKHSEVGAKIGAQLLLRAITSRGAQIESLNWDAQTQSAPAALTTVLEEARVETLVHLRQLAQAMTVPGKSFTQTVNDFFLFTTVLAIITPECTAVFAIGDGVCAINEEVVSLGPFPGNMPPYLSYSLVDTVEFKHQSELLRFRLIAAKPSSEVLSVLIGSDGLIELDQVQHRHIPGQDEPAGSIRQFWADERFEKNRYAISRRLALFNSEVTQLSDKLGERSLVREQRLLADDTTLVLIKRKIVVANA